METVKFKIIEDGEPAARGFPPVQGNGDWIDLCARARVSLDFLCPAKVRLGVAIQLPKGYEAMLCLRSSSPDKYKIIQMNAPGIIDEAYCGDEDELILSVFSFGMEIIPPGARIAQLRIFPKQNVNLEEVEFLGNPNRGGFGSTGI